jgi:hypothetical protein
MGLPKFDPSPLSGPAPKRVPSCHRDGHRMHNEVAQRRGTCSGMAADSRLAVPMNFIMRGSKWVKSALHLHASLHKTPPGRLNLADCTVELR